MDFLTSIQKIEQLSEDAQFCLCYLACNKTTNDPFISKNNIKKVKKEINSLKFDAEKAIKELSILKWVDLKNIFYREECIELVDHIFLNVLFFLFKKKEKWVKILEKKANTSSYEKEWNIVILIHQLLKGEDIQNSCHQIKKDNLIYFLPHLLEDELEPVYQNILDDYYKQLVLNQIEIACIDDEPFEYEQLKKKIQKRAFSNELEKEQLISEVELYHYFYDGTYQTQNFNKNNFAAWILEGVRAMNMGEYEKAYNYFILSFKTYNKTGRGKNIFDNALINFYYVMSVYLTTDKIPQKVTLKQLVKKTEIFENDYVYSIALLTKSLFYPLNNYFNSSSINNKYTACLFSKLEKNLLYLLCNKWDHTSFLNKAEDPFPTPHYHILRHELSPYIHLSQEEQDSLEKKFGTQPLIDTILRKSKWENVLDELIKNNTSTTAPDDKEERIVYVIYGHDYVKVLKQKKLKSGKWSPGTTIDEYKLRNENTNHLEDEDQNILKAYWKSNSYSLKTEHVLPYLIGSQRVFTYEDTGLVPVEVVEERLCLEVERTTQGFQLMANVKPSQLAFLNSDYIIKKNNPTSYSVIQVSSKNIKLLQHLLELKKFPLAAEQKLKESLPVIGTLIEIHSDMMQGGSNVERTAGDTKVSLQIHNNAYDEYIVSFRVRPLVDGKRLCVPGEGEALIADSAHDKNYRIRRNLKQEKETFEAIAAKIESIGDVSDDITPTSNVLLNTLGILQVMEYAKEQKDLCILEWDTDQKLKVKHPHHPQEWNVSLKSKSGWFEIEGEVRIDEETVLSMAELLQLFSQRQKNYLRLNDEEYLIISDALRKQLAKLEAVSTSEHGKAMISGFNAALLEDAAFKGEFTLKTEKKLKDLRTKIKESKNTAFEVPQHLNATLREYQNDGFTWMARMDSWGAGVCLADDMGLGKTIQTITFLLHKIKEGPSLVVAPVSVVPNWKKECRRFAPALQVQTIHQSNIADRNTIIQQAEAGTVVLVSYGLLLSLKNEFNQKTWNTIVLDEAHVIKNRDTKTSAAIMSLQGNSRIILTGTPIQNNLGELWNLFQFINPGLLGSWENFKTKFVVPIEEYKDKERQKQLKRIIQPFMLRRTKGEVLDDLPEKNEIIVPVEMDESEMSVYEVIRRKAENMLKEESKYVNIQTLAEITRLRQAACCISLAEKKWKGESSKIESFLQIAESLTSEGNRALVFSQFTSFLNLIRKRLDQTGISYLYLDGSTPIKEREQLVRRFQSGECQLFLISLKAGGLGLNLTGANYVIHLDPWWNPAIEQQATDRAHRIGQEQKVTVYHMISKNTIEEKILRLHETKRNLADALLEGTDMSHQLTPAELLEMIGGEK